MCLIGNIKENYGGKEIISDSMLNPQEEMKKLRMVNTQVNYLFPAK